MTDHSPPVQIEARGLSKYYGAFVAIEDISFSIPKGQIVAFLGPNGAGKSTTMKILSGFLAPSLGSATVAGMDIRTERLEVSRRLGYLPENGPLYDEMTQFLNLAFSNYNRGVNLISRGERTEGLQALDGALETPIECSCKKPGFR